MPITEAESAVMEVLWARSPLAAEDVFEALSGNRDWQETTVKTLLNRLLRKGAVRATREGRRYFYTPVLQREAWLLGESQGPRFGSFAAIYGLGRTIELIEAGARGGLVSDT